MPVESCSIDGRPGFRWGQHGPCYAYNPGDERSKRESERKAIKRGHAINKGMLRDGTRVPFTDFNLHHDPHTGRFTSKGGSAGGVEMAAGVAGSGSGAGKMVSGRKLLFKGQEVEFVRIGSISQKIVVRHPDGREEEVYRMRVVPAPEKPAGTTPPKVTPPVSADPPPAGRGKLVAGQTYKLSGGGEVVYAGPGSISQKILVKDPVTGEVREIYRQRLAKPAAPPAAPPPAAPPAVPATPPVPAAPPVSAVVGGSEFHSDLVSEIAVPQSKVSQHDYVIKDVRDPASFTGNDPSIAVTSQGNKTAYSAASWQTGKYERFGHTAEGAVSTWTDNPDTAFATAAVQATRISRSVQVVGTGKAFYQPATSVIAMGNNMSPDKVGSQHTWRHEFGHRIDHVISGGNPNGGHASSGQVESGDRSAALAFDRASHSSGAVHAHYQRHQNYQALSRKISETLASETGIYGPVGPKTDRLIDEMVNSFPELRGTDFRGWVQKGVHKVRNAEASADPRGTSALPLGWLELQPMLSFQGTTPKVLDLRKMRKDGFHENNIKAAENKAALRILGAMRTGSLADVATGIHFSNEGVNNSFSDILDGITDGRNHSEGGATGHERSYWQRAGSKGTENFANLTRIAGGSRSGTSWKITRRLIPELAVPYENILHEFVERRNPKAIKPKGATQ